MICTYDMTSGALLEMSGPGKHPAPVLNDGSHAMLYPALQPQEMRLVQDHKPARFTPDLATKPIDSFFA